MNLERMSSKTLEQRAKDNNRAIDNQWIRENEANEFYHQSGLSSFPGGIDPDILESVMNDLNAEIEKIEQEHARSSIEQLDSRYSKFKSQSSSSDLDADLDQLIRELKEQLSFDEDQDIKHR